VNPPIEPVDFDADVESLLAGADLPTADLALRRDLRLFGVRQADRLVGVIGVERHGDTGLLRSLAVAPDHRGAGLGASLVSHAEAWAAAHGIRALYLLTTTAAEFFASRGYQPVPRAGAPLAIAETPQFSELCPASSAFMRKSLAAA
jgi:amino-acid N-acetyltransferase